MKKLIALAVLAGLVLVIETLAPPFVERRLEDGIQDRTRDVARVRADTDSFPLVTRLLVTGEVRRLEIELVEVAGHAVPFAVVRYELEGVALDRSALLRREVDVEEIDRGIITAELTGADLSEILGTEVEIEPERIGAVVRAAELVLEISGLATSPIALPEELLPCEPQATVTPDRIAVSCAIHDVPPILLR